jgi:hypothetical protein
MFNINIVAGKPYSVRQVNVCFLTCTFLLGTRKRWYGNSHYAMTRTLLTAPEYHAIYDASVSSTRTTVISFAAAQAYRRLVMMMRVCLHGLPF